MKIDIDDRDLGTEDLDQEIETTGLIDMTDMNDQTVTSIVLTHTRKIDIATIVTGVETEML